MFQFPTGTENLLAVLGFFMKATWSYSCLNLTKILTNQVNPCRALLKSYIKKHIDNLMKFINTDSLFQLQWLTSPFRKQ